MRLADGTALHPARSPDPETLDRRSQVVRYAEDLIISSAQNFEDVLLFRALGGKHEGFYIDIGAGDPNWDSVTRWFYACGWSGINIEANPMFAPIFASQRPRDVNLNIGIAETEGETTFFRFEHAGWGLSSFEPSARRIANDLGFAVDEIVVPTRRLASIADEYVKGKTVDFLKIDVEGGERGVLMSGDWRAFRPLVLCIEAVHPMSARPAFPAWEPILLQAGYGLALFDGVNNYYVREESSDLLSQFNAGVNCNDRYRRMVLSDLTDANVPPPTRRNWPSLADFGRRLRGRFLV